MKLVCAMLLGFVLDLIFGDPHGLVHPVQIKKRNAVSDLWL